MGNVNYRFYEDRDAEGVLCLLNRSKYYLGKRNITARQFMDSNRERGTYCAVVGEDEENIIAYLAVYPTGDGIVCKSHQVVLGGLIVDEAYRGKLYSLGTLYKMCIKEVLKMPGITTIIAEVESFRKQSLLMQRYFGSVMVNDAVIHEDSVNEMYSFLPAYSCLFDESSMTRTVKMQELLLPADKKNYDKKDEIIDQEYVNTYVKTKYSKMRMLCHISSGYVSEVEIIDLGLTFGLSGKCDSFRIYSCKDGCKEYQISLYNDDELISVTQDDINGFSEKKILINEEVNRVHIEITGLNDSFWFYPGRIRKYKDNIEEDAPIFNRKTGEYTIFSNAVGKIKEVWPFMNPPYLVGKLAAYEGEALEYIQTENEVFEVSQKTENYLLKRKYYCSNESLTISTKLYADKGLDIAPLFHMFLMGNDSSINVQTCNGDDYYVPMDFGRDNLKASMEIPFCVFHEEAYSKENFDSISIQDGSFRCTVKTSKSAKVAFQFDYISIRYDMKNITYSDGYYDFGDIHFNIDK